MDGYEVRERVGRAEIEVREALDELTMATAAFARTWSAGDPPAEAQIQAIRNATTRAKRAVIEWRACVQMVTAWIDTNGPRSTRWGRGR